MTASPPPPVSPPPAVSRSPEFFFYLRAVLHRWFVPAGLAVLAVALVFALSPAAGHAAPTALQYKATSILIVDANAHGASPNLAEVQLITTVGAVPEAAAAELHYQGDPAQLAAQITVNVDPNVNTVKISDTGTDRAHIEQVVNAFADSLNGSLLSTAHAAFQSSVNQVQSRLNDLQKQVAKMDMQGPALVANPILGAQRDALVNQYRLAYDQFQQMASQGEPTAPFTVLQRAVSIPTGSGSARPPSSRMTRSLAAAPVGLALGLVLAVFLERLSNRVQTGADAEEAFGVPVLAEVPRLSRRRRRSMIQPIDHPFKSFVESHRLLGASVLLMTKDSYPAAHMNRGRDSRVVVVTSAEPNEGKTTTVVNLALAIAETGRSVLILDFDLAKPDMHRAFSCKRSPGLSDVLEAGPEAIDLGAAARETALRGITVVPAGDRSERSAELLTMSGTAVLTAARELADVVLIDTAPVLLVSETAEIMSHADAVIVATRVGSITREAAARSVELLRRLAAPVIGTALIGVTRTTGRSSSYHYSYYHHGYGTAPKRRWSRRKLAAGTVTSNGNSGNDTSGNGKHPVPSDSEVPPAETTEERAAQNGREAVTGSGS